jgi:hypothetical protein
MRQGRLRRLLTMVAAGCEGRFRPDNCRWVRKLASGSAGEPAGSEPRDKGRLALHTAPLIAHCWSASARSLRRSTLTGSLRTEIAHRQGMLNITAINSCGFGRA